MALTEEQAHAVLAALVVGRGPEAALPEPKAPRVGIAARLAEIAAYLGAALVVAGGTPRRLDVPPFDHCHARWLD